MFKIASIPLPTWAADSGRTATYDRATNTINVDGAVYSVATIAAGGVPGLVYKPGGHIEVTNAAVFASNVAANGGNDLLMDNNQNITDQQTKDAWELAANIRQNRAQYEHLFSIFGRTISDSDIEKLFKNTEDAGSLYDMVFEMERLAPFADVHRFFSPDEAFTIERGREYERNFIDPEGLRKFYEARDSLAAHGDDIKGLFKTFLGKDIQDTNILDWMQGKTGAQSFQKEYERAIKIEEGLQRKEQANNLFEWDEEGLKTQGIKKAFI